MSAESYLLILGERRAIAWVLREQRMAFPRTARAEVDRLAIGDELFIYTTRGAFSNPTRDRGRVVGRALVTSTVTQLDEPVEIAGREFPRGCEIRVESLAPWGSGVDLKALVDRLAAFPNPKAWSIYLRRPLLRLPTGDARLLVDLLDPLAGSLTRQHSGLPGSRHYSGVTLGQTHPENLRYRTAMPPRDPEGEHTAGQMRYTTWQTDPAAGAGACGLLDA